MPICSGQPRASAGGRSTFSSTTPDHEVSGESADDDPTARAMCVVARHRVTTKASAIGAVRASHPSSAPGCASASPGRQPRSATAHHTWPRRRPARRRARARASSLRAPPAAAPARAGTGTARRNPSAGSGRPAATRRAGPPATESTGDRPKSTRVSSRAPSGQMTADDHQRHGVDRGREWTTPESCTVSDDERVPRRGVEGQRRRWGWSCARATARKRCRCRARTARR